MNMKKLEYITSRNFIHFHTYKVDIVRKEGSLPLAGIRAVPWRELLRDPKEVVANQGAYRVVLPQSGLQERIWVELKFQTFLDFWTSTVSWTFELTACLIPQMQQF